jgi:hypothetical protein
MNIYKHILHIYETSTQQQDKQEKNLSVNPKLLQMKYQKKHRLSNNTYNEYN